MSFTYTYGTNIGRVRLLITDTDSTEYIFDDDEVQEFLDLATYNSNVDIFEAAAFALETIATSEVLVQKAVKILDISTDGTKVADNLMKRAEKLRKVSEQQATFDIATMNVNNWTAIDLIINKWLKDE